MALDHLVAPPVGTKVHDGISSVMIIRLLDEPMAIGLFGGAIYRLMMINS